MLNGVTMNEPIMMVIANVSARPHTEPPDIRAKLIEQVVPPCAGNTPSAI